MSGQPGLRCLATILVLLALTRGAAAQDAQGPTLMEAREGFATRLVPNSYESGGPADEPGPDDPYVKVKYPSQVGELVAYLTPDRHDGEKRPAIVWAHGGFGGIGRYYWSPQQALNDQTPKAFVDAGFVVMLPSWRGENENPGNFELFYGEVDDAIAAVDYVSKLPYVDPDRIYFAGHSTGGTVTLLTALSDARIRAAFSFGGAPDLSRLVKGGGYGNTPFDITEPREAELRSAVQFAQTLRTPTWYFEGEDSAYCEDALRMQRKAKASGAPFTATIVKGGNHFDILRPLTALIAAKAAADTGPTCTIEITPDEVSTAYTSAREEHAKLPLLTLTAAAAEKLLTDMKQNNLEPAETYLRLAPDGLMLTTEVDPSVDETTTSRGVNIVMAKEASRDARGLTLDYSADEGFELIAPDPAK